MANRSDDLNRTGNVLLHGATPSGGGSAWNDLTSSFKTNADGGTGEVTAYEYNASGNNVASMDAGVTDVLVQCEVIRIDSQGGPAARVADASNFYFFYAKSDGTTELYKRVGGTYTLLASGSLTFTPGVGNTLGIRCVGTSIKGYVNGAEAASVTDSDLTTGNSHGVRTQNSFNLINSFSITDLSGGGVKAGAIYHALLSGGVPL